MPATEQRLAWNTESRLDLGAPIVATGAGRSGSTLICAVLDTHPEISFAGENHFIVPKLWAGFFETPENATDSVYVGWMHYWQTLREVIPQMDVVQFREQEQERIAAILRPTIAEILRIDPSKRAWGFKELWMGSYRCADLDWRPYDHVYPHATWVHLIRNPVRQAASVLSIPFYAECRSDASFIALQIQDWVRMTAFSRQRHATGRYFEIRYEDLVSEPRRQLEPILQSVGLEWSDDCLAAFGERYVASSADYTNAVHSALEGRLACPGLHGLVRELGYLEEIEALGFEVLDDEASRGRSFHLSAEDDAHISERLEEHGDCPGAAEVARLWPVLVELLRPMRILESGADDGHTTAQLAAALRDAGLAGRVTTIDPSPRDPVWKGGDLERYVEWIPKTSRQALAELERSVFDMVVLHGDPTYRTLLWELYSFDRLLRVGGLFLLYGTIYHDGVGAAITQLYENPRFEIITLDTPRAGPRLDDHEEEIRLGTTLVRKIADGPPFLQVDGSLLELPAGSHQPRSVLRQWQELRVRSIGARDTIARDATRLAELLSDGAMLSDPEGRLYVVESGAKRLMAGPGPRPRHGVAPPNTFEIDSLSAWLIPDGPDLDDS